VEQVGTDPKGHPTGYRLIVTNDQKRPVTLEVEFARDAGTRLVSRTRLSERDGFALWTVTIPGNGTATLNYRVAQVAPSASPAAAGRARPGRRK
jgi:hypothetical protein